MLRATFLCFLVSLQWDFLRAAYQPRVAIQCNVYPSLAVVSHIDHLSLCGATIITKRLVLTARTCVADDEPSNVRVAVGQLSEQQEYSAVKFYTYQFEVEKNHSVSLVEVSSDFQMSQSVKVVALPYGLTIADMKDLKGSSLLVTDWEHNAWLIDGHDVVGGVLNLTVMYTFIGDDEKCTKQNRWQDFICTSNVHNVTLKTIGGPILFRNHSTGAVKIVGVVTTGSFLERPLVTYNMNVIPMLSWLEIFLKN